MLVPARVVLEATLREVVAIGVTSVASLGSLELDQLSLRLPETEIRVASEMQRHAQRGHFVVGRLLVRSLAAKVMGMNACELVIDVEQRGRPVVANAPFPLFVSIAHSENVVVAAAARRRVGVDVERVAAHRHPGIFRRVCSSRELRLLARTAHGDRDRAFVSIWSRKEAYGKALGVGLDYDLRAVSVGPKGAKVRGAAGVWRVRDFDAIEGYVIAAAAPGRTWRAAVDIVGWRDL
jgi:4'-phosphopantetheinyl transferase